LLPYTPPEYQKSAFNCPYCGAFARQTWNAIERYMSGIHQDLVSGLFISTCERCKLFSVWLDELMIHPLVDGVPNPHFDMPEDVKADYEEARSIVLRSPRGAAALLRLAIQKLTEIILAKDKGKDLNDNIRKLVEKGMRQDIQKACDTLRVIGNHAVHPGELNIKDNREIANKLFVLLNKIVDTMITDPKEISILYDSLPEKDKLNIENRDNKNQNQKKRKKDLK
jgi:hypothetical protein